VLRIKMRAGVLALLALFIISGIAASTSSATAGPFWHVGGVTLKGSKSIKLQLKSPTAVLKSASLGFEIICNGSTSIGATIEGNGTTQGLGQGKVSYSSCKVPSPSGCKVGEPIVTNQIKSYLGEETGVGSKNYVEVLEPTSGKIFVELKLSTCGVLPVLEPVDGSVYAEVIPKGVEGQEGLLNFPTEPLEKIKHEGTETKIGLTVGGSAVATFSGAYGARLSTFPEKFGVFAT